MNDTGAPWPAVATSGIWNPSDFRGYVGMPRDAEMGGSQLFGVERDPTSENED